MMKRSTTRGAARRLCDRAFVVFCLLALVFGIGFLLATLYSLVVRGLPGMSLALVTENTPPPGVESGGGLLNAIVGSLIITALAMAIATPIGVLIATYLVEFKGRGRLANFVRFMNDVLLSGPSIIVGLFVYALLVRPMGGFSGLAGAVALAVIAVPMIVRPAEGVLALIPQQVREAAVALGVPRWKVTVLILWRAATGGLITAVLLATARVAGETAPLLFTALNNQFFSADIFAPMANLPVVMFNFALSPYENWQNLAWSGAVLITLSILVLSIVARLVFREQR